jgi:hypothetical protein
MAIKKTAPSGAVLFDVRRLNVSACPNDTIAHA